MIDLMSIYLCPSCGEVLADQVTKTEIIDCDQDEVIGVILCNKCNREVKDTGSFQSVDHERWLWLSGYYDEDNPYEEGEDPEVFYGDEDQL